ncbi:MAG TPA: TatD family hydrolase, partial [Acidobacteriota bacterium]|nr:TatD family hydrolase [Acidobacteriota bacterium]
MIVDTHAHLDMPQFDADRHQVIRGARNAGLESIVAIAMASPDRTSLSTTLKLVDRYDFLHAAVAVHPHDARAATPAFLDSLAASFQHPKVAFWGEIGLDYHYKNSPIDKQKNAFRKQLEYAQDLGKPVIIHCRDAWQDLLAILEQESKGRKLRGILHNFTGSEDQAERCLSLGLLLSFSGIITFKSSDNLRRVARGLRLDQIVVETDAPYLAPSPHRAIRNQPLYVFDVARGVASAMEVSLDDIARNTTCNFKRLLGKGPSEENAVLVYAIRDRLYVNLTNRCTAHCVFCRRESSPIASGYDLKLEQEHSVSAYLEAVGDPQRYAEIVFCGFGEPTIRLDELLEIGRSLKTRGARLRLNTNGHGNLIHGRDIIPDLAGCLDEISVSIDAADEQTYNKIVRPDFGAGSFMAVVDFVKGCVGKIPRVQLTAVNIPGLNLEGIRNLARDLGVEFRLREYQPMVGSTDFT